MPHPEQEIFSELAPYFPERGMVGLSMTSGEQRAFWVSGMEPGSCAIRATVTVDRVGLRLSNWEIG